jgi:hypothetical protein
MGKGEPERARIRPDEARENERGDSSSFRGRTVYSTKMER